MGTNSGSKYSNSHFLQPGPHAGRLLLVSCCLVGFFMATFHCNPSPFILKKYAVYNFTEEGFLTPHMLQTIGKGTLPEDKPGLRAARTGCLEIALYRAMRRTLSVFLHTYYNIPPRQSSLAAGTAAGFSADYPFEFTERDYARAEIDFRPLLKKGFIALQDARSTEECTVIFRIMEEDLPEQIRGMKLTFTPENYRPEQDNEKRNKEKLKYPDKQKTEENRTGQNY